ncbi:MAG: hypothetical protein NTW86_24180 [Candidatus Sumerlaeota bacterium]|nr:hypothetical protein [Candidatus Sumerlaeota bacterium]
MSATVPFQFIHGQPSYVLETPDVRLAMTRIGCHMAPVEFLRQSGKPFQPYYVAPWAEEGCDPATPPILQVLRGDFFCLPFGANATEFRGERYPLHGEPANEAWALLEHESDSAGARMRLALDLKVRRGRIEKSVILPAGENLVYTSDAVSGMSGPMNFGHHATLQFPDVPGCGRISFSPWRHAQVYIRPTELPEEKGYSILQPGALIDDLTKVARIDGATTDLTRYPARRGFEDIAIVCAKQAGGAGAAEPDQPFAWSAAVFEPQRMAWFALKDPGVLPSTLIWISNMGRYYAPWSGRNLNVLALEDILGFFHDGVAASAGDNELARRGIPTTRQMDPARPVAVNYIQGVAPVPEGFGAVKAIEAAGAKAVCLIGDSGAKAEVPCRVGFLKSGKI